MEALIENNKLIAEFMGLVVGTTQRGYDDLIDNDIENAVYLFHKDNLPYHRDWNWLMTVIEKIEKMGYWVDYTKGDVFIYDDNYNLVIPNPMHENDDTKLSIHYKIAVEFIKWHNRQAR